MRLAYQFALIAMILVSCRAVLDGVAVPTAFESALIFGAIAGGFGYVVSLILDRLATEHVAVLAGQTADAAEATTNSADRISSPEMNN